LCIHRRDRTFTAAFHAERHKRPGRDLLTTASRDLGAPRRRECFSLRPRSKAELRVGDGPQLPRGPGASRETDGQQAAGYVEQSKSLAPIALLPSMQCSSAFAGTVPLLSALVS
jgi:hypothetical protein